MKEKKIFKSYGFTVRFKEDFFCGKIICDYYLNQQEVKELIIKKLLEAVPNSQIGLPQKKSYPNFSPTMEDFASSVCLWGEQESFGPESFDFSPNPKDFRKPSAVGELSLF